MIRANVLHGKKSVSCANSVLPVFMARSSPAEGRRGPHGIQIDTTDSGQKSKHYPPLIGDPRSANRTVVMLRMSVIDPVRVLWQSCRWSRGRNPTFRLCSMTDMEQQWLSE